MARPPGAARRWEGPERGPKRPDLDAFRGSAAGRRRVDAPSLTIYARVSFRPGVPGRERAVTNRILLVLVGTLAVAPASAQTRAVPPKPAASGLSDQQKLEQAEAHLGRMKQVLKQVIGRLED